LKKKVILIVLFSITEKRNTIDKQYGYITEPVNFTIYALNTILLQITVVPLFTYVKQVSPISKKEMLLA